MKEGFKKYWNTILSCIIGIVIGILLNIPTCNKIESKTEYIPVHDTVTITKDSIIYKTKPVNVYLIDTFYVKESGDTVQLDSIPITEYKYQDTIKTDSTSTEITVDYYGFNAGINNINLLHSYFEKQTTIVKEPKKVGAVWAIGIGVGIGGHANINTGTFGYGPEIGLYGIVGIGGRIK